MKRLFILLIAIIICSCNSGSFKNSPVLTATGQSKLLNKNQVDFIKSQFSLINNNLKSFKKVTKEDTLESTEGNEVTLYYNGDAIEKISAEYMGEMGKDLEEYYFSNKKLIFYYAAQTHYKQPFYLTPGKVLIAAKDEKRYYFNDDTIFLVKLSPKQTVSQTDYKKLSAETRKEAYRLMSLKVAQQ
jgi:hypothetical protein